MARDLGGGGGGGGGGCLAISCSKITQKLPQNF